MTAINLFVGRDRIDLFTDGAAVDPAGRIVSMATKVFRLTHLNAVLAIRGPDILLPLLGLKLQAEAVDFDSLQEVCGRKLKQLTSEVIVSGDPEFELVLAGVPATGPVAFFTPCHDRYGTAAEWRPVAIPTDLITPDVPPDVVAAFGTSASPVALMNAQRVRVAQAELANSVGCFIEHTVITADAITSRIIHRWPADRVGGFVQLDQD